MQIGKSPRGRLPFAGLRISASGLTAQRRRLEVVAENIANASTTRTPDGGPYRRRFVQFAEIANTEPADAAVSPDAVEASGPRTPRGATEIPESPQALTTGGVAITGVVEDMTDGPLVYDPGHPDADESGYVRMPNVSMTEEMADLMDARRLFEANASTFQAIKAMLRRAIQI